MIVTVTVRTNASKIFKFCLDDNLTVREFKDRIESYVQISANLQAVMYCGTLLNDDIQLNTINVNKCVLQVFPNLNFVKNKFGIASSNIALQNTVLKYDPLQRIVSALEIHSDLSRSYQKLVCSRRVFTIQFMLGCAKISSEYFEKVMNDEEETPTGNFSKYLDLRLEYDKDLYAILSTSKMASGEPDDCIHDEQSSPNNLFSYLTELRYLQKRLDPFLIKYQQILFNDPELVTNSSNMKIVLLMKWFPYALYYLAQAEHDISNRMKIYFSKLKPLPMVDDVEATNSKESCETTILGEKNEPESKEYEWKEEYLEAESESSIHLKAPQIEVSPILLGE